MKMDIQNRDDIKTFVNGFYDKVQHDPLLAPVFASRVNDWTPHLETMYRFWGSILFQEQSYHGRPFPKHFDLPVTAEHFQRWVNLFHATIDTHFTGPRADDVKRRAENIALMFQSKIARLKGNTNSIL